MRWYLQEHGWSVDDLCHAANDHMVAALQLFDSKNPQVQDSAGFLAHLAIELLLKAALLTQTGKFPNTHELTTLRSHLAEADQTVELSAGHDAAFDRISSFHDLRYHDPSGLPEIGHPDRETLHHLFLELVTNLPTQVSQAIENIDHTEKSGRSLVRKRGS